MSAAHALSPEPAPTAERLAAALESFGHLAEDMPLEALDCITHLAAGHSLGDAYAMHGAQKLRELMNEDARHWLSTLEKSDTGVRHPVRARQALSRFQALLGLPRWYDSGTLGELRALAREILAALGVA